jgi:polysaccharide deacetylase family protein (PEP-CTERM system associated)
MNVLAPKPFPLLLSFDIENWYQLLYREFGVDSPEEGLNAALSRQVLSLLEILDELKASATFFLLGESIIHCPDIVAEIANRGHEIACHGHCHKPVMQLSPDEFRRDVESALDAILRVSPNRPIGYRAPFFSINKNCIWALEILSNLGFTYDSSLHDSPKIPERIKPIPQHPFTLELPSGNELKEFPISLFRFSGFNLPIGGGTYWRVLPQFFLRFALRSLIKRNPTSPVLYFHPYEFDPQPLKLHLPQKATSKQKVQTAYLEARYGFGRRSSSAKLRDMSRFFSFSAIQHALNPPAIKQCFVRIQLSSHGTLHTTANLANCHPCKHSYD